MSRALWVTLCAALVTGGLGAVATSCVADIYGAPCLNDSNCPTGQFCTRPTSAQGTCGPNKPGDGGRIDGGGGGGTTGGGAGGGGGNVGPELCGDGLDNDADGDTDCADADCAGAVCRPNDGGCDLEERCTAGQATCPANAFHDAGTPCGAPASCSNSMLRTGAFCNGAGTCVNGAATSCGGYTCASSTACRTSCANASDCEVNFTCVAPACTVSTTKANGQPCAAGPECTSGFCGSFFIDADTDTFGTGGSTKLCAMNASSPPSGYATSSNDCCDSDARARPGQTMFFGSTNTCGNWDYDCNGTGDLQAPSSGCFPAPPMNNTCPTENCTANPGWLGPVPACGAMGNYATSCATNPCPPVGCAAGCSICQPSPIGAAQARQQLCH